MALSAREDVLRRLLATLRQDQLAAVEAVVSREWELVRRWPGMRGEDKLAWLYLWQRSRGGREQVSVTAGDVAADQQVSSDAGLQRLKNLIAKGLCLKRDHDRVRGVWLIEMADPATLEIGRRIRCDPQGELAFSESETDPPFSEPEPTGGVRRGTVRLIPTGEAPEEPPELPPEEPRQRASSETSSESKRALTSSIFGKSSETSSEARASRGCAEDRSRGSSGGSSAASRGSAGATAIGDVLAATLARLPSREQQQADAEALVALMQRRVGDPRLRTAPCLRLAWAVVEGRVERVAVMQLLDALDRRRSAGQLLVPASAYFVMGAQRIFQRAEAPD